MATSKAVIALRHKLQHYKVKTPMTLEAPGKPPLDLNDATAEQVQIYIIQLRLSPPDSKP